jgi:hypothetical protein
VIDVDVAGLTRQWVDWMRAGRALAGVLRQQGDDFGASLHIARGEVRAAAAELLRTATDPMAAARIMHDRAARLARRTDHGVLFTEYDEAGRQYVRALAWQACAQAVDPSLPEVQPIWED